jgi:hypothetical protein
MKTLIAAVAVLSLTACSSTQKSFSETKETSVKTVETTQKGNVAETFPTVPDFEVHAMTRMEVISAVDQCKDNGMRPFVEYISQKTAYGRVLTPVNVHCNPNRSAN